MSRQRQKGTEAETAVVRWLRERGWRADRSPLRGTRDEGDITGIPGVCIEVKNHRSIDLAGWVRQLEAEVDNSGADVGMLIIKRRGTTDVGQWYAVMTVDQAATLLGEAGW